MEATQKSCKPLLKPGSHFLMGDEAAAEGAIAAGCRFFAGYPITPASETMQHIVNRFHDVNGVFVQMEDEIGSISAMVGAAWAGAKSMTATSGPGLSLMMECLGYAAFTETPIVIVDIQRAGPCTGQATRPGSGDIQQVKWGSHGDYQIIALSPWSVQEMYDLTIEAFNLSERFRNPAFLLADEGTGHLREQVIIPESHAIWDRPYAPGKPPFGDNAPDGVPSMPKFGDGENLLVTGSTHDDWGYRKTQASEVHQRLVYRINRKITDHAEELAKVESYWLDDAEIAVVAYGFTARAAFHAVKLFRERGHKIGLLRLITIWPFPEKALIDALRQVKHILIPEMNLGQIAHEVERLVNISITRLPQVNGEVMTPTPINQALEKIISN
jgi:2-oxoglutarate ferredoxin oxidoreductase subunit alpha